MDEVKRYSDKQIDILMILADDMGHAQWEISKFTKTASSNISNMVKELLKDHIIFKGAPRNTTNPLSKHPRSEETPLYIKKDLKVYRTILININDKVNENDMNIFLAKNNEALAISRIRLERTKLRFDKKNLLNNDDYEKLKKKLEEMKKFRGKDKSFYEKECKKYMDYIEKFVSSTYTEGIIKEFGFEAVVRTNVQGILDLWYMSKIYEISLNKNFVDKKHADEVKNAMLGIKEYDLLPIVYSKRIPIRILNSPDEGIDNVQNS